MGMRRREALPHYFHNIRRWYRPAEHEDLPRRRPGQPLVAGPDRAMGKPLKTLTVGRLQVYVYDDDIASSSARRLPGPSLGPKRKRTERPRAP